MKYGVKVHPSEKPIKLMEHFILNSSNKNDIIFDPFMGSGTTRYSMHKYKS
jgi:site-specific DNA-methyltransferase (adenine-specific)